MKALIKKELRLSARTLLIWMWFILMLCGFAYFEYLSLKDSLGELAQWMQHFPRILLLMFGAAGDLAATLGWYGCIYYWVAILDFSYAMYLGVSCMDREKAQGTSEYLFTKPVSRRQILCAKSLASVWDLLVLAGFSGLCNYATAIAPLGGLEQKGAAFTTTLGLFLTETVLFALGLLAAALTNTYAGAVRLGAGLLLGFYGISIAADYVQAPALYVLTPLKYFDVYAVAEHGFRLVFLLLAGVLVLVSLMVSLRRWEKREL